MSEFSDVARKSIISNINDIRERLGIGETETIGEQMADNYEDVIAHNLYGIHIKEKNDALSETNPHICIGWSLMGDLSSINDKKSLIELYEQHFEKNNRGKGQDVGQIWRFKNDIKIGDYVIFAENSVFHIGQVESDYYYDNTENSEQSDDYTNNRKVKWLKKNISRSVLSKNFHNSLRTAMSVWALNDYKAAVVDLLRETYVKDEDIETDESNESIVSCLDIVRNPRTNKIHPINFIVYGAPGTGKTYSMVEYALAIVDNVTLDEFRIANIDRKANVNRYKELVKAGQVVFTTFHQNYGYEEFIQGLRPDKGSDTMAFKVVDGVFKNIADTALKDTDGKNYIIIIDEINRANISKVFGELITLIEEDKRWGELNEASATLQSGDQFAVPNNLYIVGTMNSADKSISLIDAALRRRFDFIEQKPDSSLVTDPVLKVMLENINASLVDELDSTDLLVGHSYFMNKTEKDLCNILNNNIIPLLYEYFYDNRKKVANILNDAIKKADAKVEIVDEKVGRLRVKEV
jgi:Cdc6-like AAA superfamily ATPase